jgi:hypothetical protein
MLDSRLLSYEQGTSDVVVVVVSLDLNQAPQALDQALQAL